MEGKRLLSCRFYCFFHLLLLFSFISCSVGSLPKISLKQISDGSRVFIETETKREVIFHGSNSIVKGFPWIPESKNFDVDTSLSTKDHATLSDLGLYFSSLLFSLFIIKLYLQTNPCKIKSYLLKIRRKKV